MPGVQIAVHVKSISNNQSVKKECTVKLDSNSRIIDLKEHLSTVFDVPIIALKLLCNGRPLLSDVATLNSLAIIDGTRLTLMIANTAPSALFNHLNALLCPHFNAADIQRIILNFDKQLESSIEKLSLDDIEKMARTLLADVQ